VSRKRFRRSLAVFAALVACAVLVVAPTSPARAGGCYSAASYSYGYAAYPTYAYPASYTYYTPTYYTPRYEVQEVVVPKAVRAFVSPDYYSSTSDYFRDRNLIDAIAGKGTDLTKLQQELSELKAAIKQGQAAPQQPAPQPAPAYYAPPAPAPLPPQQYQQTYQQQGGTPCDWRAQNAYQQGMRDAQQQAQAQAQTPSYQPPQGPSQQPPPQQPAYQGQGYGQPPQPPHAPQDQGGYGAQGYRAPNPPPAPALGGSNYGQGAGSTDQGPPAGSGHQPRPTHPPSSPRNPVPADGGDPAPLPPESQASGSQPSDYGPVPEGLAAVVQDACLRCHGAQKDDMGHGFDLRNLKAVRPEDRAESWAMASSGEMPFKGEKLPPEKVALFKSWSRAAKHQSRTRADAQAASRRETVALRR
jgi:hypothetical protein